MTKRMKIELIRSVMDELAVIAYLENPKDKTKAIELINDYLANFTLPDKPQRYDYCLNNAKVSAKLGNQKNSKLLPFVLKELETALSLLRK